MTGVVCSNKAQGTTSMNGGQEEAQGSSATLIPTAQVAKRKKDGERTACLVKSWHMGTNHCFLQMSRAMLVGRERSGCLTSRVGN